MTGPTYTAQGKQVLRDNQHFADVCSADAARAVATLLNCEIVQHETGTPVADLDHMVEVLWS